MSRPVAPPDSTSTAVYLRYDDESAPSPRHTTPAATPASLYDMAPTYEPAPTARAHAPPINLSMYSQAPATAPAQHPPKGPVAAADVYSMAPASWTATTGPASASVYSSAEFMLSSAPSAPSAQSASGLHNYEPVEMLASDTSSPFADPFDSSKPTKENAEEDALPAAAPVLATSASIVAQDVSTWLQLKMNEFN